MSTILHDFMAACRKVSLHGLVSASSGNLSCRVGDDRMLLTSSGSWMESITPDQVAEIRCSNGSVFGQVRPSAERDMHREILLKRDDVNVVLHFQSPHATAVACVEEEVTDYSVIPEVPYYIGNIRTVPYLDPGSLELAAAVASAMEACDLVVLQNHGQVTVGKTFDDTIQKAVFFELASEIILKAGGNVKTISPEASHRLRGMYKKKG